MATVLVTGAAGYVGSPVHDPLKQAGHQPVVFDNLSRGFAQLVEPHQVPLVVGHLASHALVRSVLEEYRVEAILHFAALAHVGESSEQPDRDYRVNTADAFGLLEEANTYRPQSPAAAVLSSTCAVFGVPPSLPIAELTPRTPINPYGRSKLALEWMLEDQAQRYRFPAVILRYVNAAGADPQNGSGACHHPETHLIPLAIETALDNLIAGGTSTDFNLGTGFGYSVRDALSWEQQRQQIAGLGRPLAVGV